MTAPPTTWFALLAGAGRPADERWRLVPETGISLPLRMPLSKGRCAEPYHVRCTGAHQDTFSERVKNGEASPRPTPHQTCPARRSKMQRGKKSGTLTLASAWWPAERAACLCRSRPRFGQRTWGEREHAGERDARDRSDPKHPWLAASPSVGHLQLESPDRVSQTGCGTRTEPERTSWCSAGRTLRNAFQRPLRSTVSRDAMFRERSSLGPL